MELVVSQLLTGLSIASILMLVALGLAVIYGVTGVINLAHGEFVMLGAYCAWFLQSQLGMGLLESLIPIFFILAVFGWAVEALVISQTLRQTLRSVSVPPGPPLPAAHPGESLLAWGARAPASSCELSARETDRGVKHTLFGGPRDRRMGRPVTGRHRREGVESSTLELHDAQPNTGCSSTRIP